MGVKFPGTHVCRSTSARRHKDLRYNLLTQLSQKKLSPPKEGEDLGGGKRSTMSTPIPTFPHRKGEGDEMRNRLILIN